MRARRGGTHGWDAQARSARRCRAQWLLAAPRARLLMVMLLCPAAVCIVSNALSAAAGGRAAPRPEVCILIALSDGAGKAMACDVWVRASCAVWVKSSRMRTILSLPSRRSAVISAGLHRASHMHTPSPSGPDGDLVALEPRGAPPHRPRHAILARRDTHCRHARPLCPLDT